VSLAAKRRHEEKPDNGTECNDQSKRQNVHQGTIDNVLHREQPLHYFLRLSFGGEILRRNTW
jgi:hypothetical protein